MSGQHEKASRILRGECLCRAVKYEVKDAFAYAMNCHCSNCRRATGSAFKPFAGIRMEEISLLAERSAVSIYGNPDEAHDIHCTACGSLLYSVVPPNVHVTLGTLVDDPSIRPTGHIFVGSKAPWHEITDGLPQYREFPED